MIGLTIYTLFLLVAFGFFGYSVSKVLKVLRLGKPENRWNNFGIRIKNTVKIALLQSKIMRQKFAGFLHVSIFWGFCVLLLVVIEGLIEGYKENFSFAFIGKPYSLVTVTQDLFGLLVLVVALFSLGRRFIGTPKRLRVEKSSRLDAALVLVLISLVMLTMFGMNIEKELLGTLRGARPITKFFASFFNAHNGSETTMKIFWWLHNILVLGFLNYLPYSKHFHVLSSIPNTFLSNFGIEKKNTIKPLNFEDETVEQYGAKDITDITWKQILDGYTCTECGRCTQACPANFTGKILNPKKIITDVRKRAKELSQTKSDEGKDTKVEKTLVPDFITPEELWSCTTCAACVEECPVMIDHLTTIIDLRRNLAMMESDFPKEVATVFKNLENNESPWAFGAEARNEWIMEFEKENPVHTLVKLSESGNANAVDIVFWVGCAGAFDKRYRNVTKSIAKILSKAEIKFGVLGNEEKCNGDTARRLGNEFLAQQFINANIETFKKYGIKKVLTACPHCFHSLKNEYTQFGIELEVYHHSEYILKLINNSKITLAEGKTEKITYHDSCYLGRYNNIYNAPRNVLEKLPATTLIEMNRNKDKGFCCGAGGGRMFMEETVGKRVNLERTEEAISTGSDTICSACPFCMTMLSDGVKALEKAEVVKVKDLAEIIADSLI
ncbi:MAG: (Fe-S)-binding protein [Ignavibacteria bacterium]